MLLTITTTYQPATDLGFLLVKNPARCQSFSLSFGQAHVFYPVAHDSVCTAALLVDLDPIRLVRRRSRQGQDRMLGQYVNDRPYVASSFLSVALARVYKSALGGQSKERPALAATAIPLEAQITAVQCRDGERMLRALFEPLGYNVSAERQPLDAAFPEWGESTYWSIALNATHRLHDLLTHLYVLLPVLDDDKHYWVGKDELEKLLAKGAGWLSTHPERDLIVDRYLRYRRLLTREALARLVVEDDIDPDATEEAQAREEEVLEDKISLSEQRMMTVLAVLRGAGATRVIDLGCGEGKFLQMLLKNTDCEQITGMDVSSRALALAKRRLRLDRLPAMQRARIKLFQGALTYRDQRLTGYDAACALEVIEHLEPSRLGAFERVLFEFTRPSTVVITTPNTEYNVQFENLSASRFRHSDHRFEWTREEFSRWVKRVADRSGYEFRLLPIGPVDPAVGPPTQMAVFSR